jgi:hypothetical protein
MRTSAETPSKTSTPPIANTAPPGPAVAARQQTGFGSEPSVLQLLSALAPLARAKTITPAASARTAVGCSRFSISTSLPLAASPAQSLEGSTQEETELSFGPTLPPFSVPQRRAYAKLRLRHAAGVWLLGVA